MGLFRRGVAIRSEARRGSWWVQQTGTVARWARSQWTARRKLVAYSIESIFELQLDRLHRRSPMDAILTPDGYGAGEGRSIDHLPLQFGAD